MKRLRARLPLRLSRLLAELAPVAAFAVAFPLRDFMAQDVVVAHWQEMLFLIFIYTLVALVFVLIYHYTLKQPLARLVAALLAVYYLMATYYLQGQQLATGIEHVTHFGGTGVAVALILGASWVAGWVVTQILSRLWREGMNVGASLVRVMCVVFLVLNIWLVVQYLHKQQVSAAFMPDTTAAQVQLAGNSRDIYYFVFDRYASQQSLTNYYDFNNASFLDAIKAQGFSIRDDAYANYQYTAPSIASTLRMDYHTDITTALGSQTAPSSLPYRSIIENSPVSSDLRNDGYDIVNIGSWWEVTRQQNNATNILPKFQLSLLGHSWNLSELQTNSLTEGFLAPLLQGGLHIGSFQLLRITNATDHDVFLDQVQSVKQVATEAHDKPRYVFVHMLNPHPPYVFAADGSVPGYDGSDSNNGAPRATKYTSQMKYDNSQILDMIQTIKANAKTPPIIIMQADEGPYPLAYDSGGNLKNDYKWQNVPTDALKEKFGVFSAFDLPDLPATADPTPSSSVNTFRYVFNNYFGTSLPYLPDCSLVFNLGDHPFQFYDITGKLHAETGDCKAYTGQ